MVTFNKPEDITALDSEALQASIDEANAAAAEFAGIDDSEITDEQIAEFEAVIGFLDEANSEVGNREQAAAARSEKLAGLRSAIPGKDDDEEDAPAEDAPAEEDIPAEPAEDQPIVEEDIVDDIEEEKKPVTKAAVTDTASVRRGISKVARSAKKTEEAQAKKPGFGIFAAADVPGFAAGQEFSSLTDASKAIKARADRMSAGAKGQFGALVIKANPTEMSQDNFRSDLELLMAAGNERRLEGQSLVAAGGWGAPSETLLDFCKIESTEGLLNLPEVTITRGGIQYTKGPTFADVFNSSTGFWDMDEATAEAGTELKTSYRPEVPPFEEERLDAVGVMMEAGLLTRAGWPELVERYAELGLVAHQHKVAGKVLNGVRGFTGAPIALTDGYGNAFDILHYLELVATGERERNVMSLSATLEVLLPHWVKNVIRVDLANRNGIDNFLNVTDQQINAFFTARNLRVQFLYGMQNLPQDASGIVKAYPTTVEAIMYPAGTYVKGVADVITLDTVYDSVNLKKNDYLHLFVEQGVLVTNPCGEGRRLTLPVAPTGRTGAADLSKAFSAPVAP